jgi:uncharacterized protein YyaL (SSP411 family)
MLEAVPNRLASESSPYLLQHKDNPVDWYPWGPEAFDRARSEGKPVFLSIGYSTCHWCHVMEHESFENAEIAGALNRDFVPIKVDREERPDVDDIYMAAVQAMTGSGGWPLSLFLTPEGKPFFGGTYFPPEDRWGRPGFRTVLSSVARAWNDRREQVEESAGEMLQHLDAHARGLPAVGAADPAAIANAARALAADYDPEHGGFGGAPKFPPAMRLELLMRWERRSKDVRAREMVERTLEEMAAGGLYDQIGGGFHRYSVDEAWRVPHFEKMLYDNAMLARVFLLAARAYGREDFRRIARETLDYLSREMTPRGGGGFFAAQDADSGGHEGTFYVWNPETIREAVGDAAAPIVCARFGVDASGNFEGGETVLSVARAADDLAREFHRSESEIEAVLEEARRKMFALRAERVPPGTDDKLLTDWSALAISAFALGGRLCAEPRYEEIAREAAERILRGCRRGGMLLHRERKGRCDIAGFSTDYALLIEALLDLYEATFAPRYFREAVALQDELERRFADGRGGYALSSEDHDGLILRPRELYDGATPSANSVSASNLLRLASFTGREAYRRRADEIFEACSGYLARAPLTLPRMLSALDFATGGPREVVLSGDPGEAAFERLRAAVDGSAEWNRVVAHADREESLADLVPIVSGRGGAGSRTRAFVCRDSVCGLPVSEPAALRAALDA